MNRPPLLLADEPTGALDTASGRDVARLLADLNADGQTVVVVTHDLALARSCTTRTIRLVDGRITADGPTGDLARPEDGVALADGGVPVEPTR
jgi:putative ABC transport system ATP-binding protein